MALTLAHLQVAPGPPHIVMRGGALRTLGSTIPTILAEICLLILTVFQQVAIKCFVQTKLVGLFFNRRYEVSG